MRDHIVGYQVQKQAEDRYEKAWVTINNLADIFQVNPVTITRKYSETLKREKKNKKPSKQRIPWARLLARVFNIDVETCPHSQGRVKIIAAVEDPAVIVKILEHLGLPTRAPRVHSARGPQRPSENADLDMDQFPSIDAYFDPIFQD